MTENLRASETALAEEGLTHLPLVSELIRAAFRICTGKTTHLSQKELKSYDLPDLPPTTDEQINTLYRSLVDPQTFVTKTLLKAAHKEAIASTDNPDRSID